MWCVMKCLPGKAETIMESCRKKLSGQVLHDVFMFTYERMKRYEGSWHLETHQMFPDYLFLETETPERLSEQLEPYRSFVQILEDGNMLLRVRPEEEAFLRSLCGQAHHLGMSRGYIQNGITHICQGPLMGLERRIRKIDRHKRLAKLTVPFQGLETPMQAGLEITSKN